MPKYKWLSPGPKLTAPNGNFTKSKLWGRSTLELQQTTGIKCRKIERWEKRLAVGDSKGIVKRQRKSPCFTFAE